MTEKYREEMVFRAKLAENCDLYADLVQFASEFARLGEDPPSAEERSLISLGYMCEVNTRKTAIRILARIAVREQAAGHIEKTAIVQAYMEKIAQEVITLCTNYTQLIEQCILGKAIDQEQRVLWTKIKSDYYRTVCEVSEGDVRAQFVRRAQEGYEEGTQIAASELSPGHPQRLAVALSSAVFSAEVLNDWKRGVEVARRACDEAERSGDVPGNKDAECIMQLLKDTLLIAPK